MKILKMIIDWNYKYGNPPDLNIIVDKIPHDLIYAKNGNLYYAESEGFVSFYRYTLPGNGLGGRTVELIMDDGSIKVLRGPWITNSAVINRAGFGPCMDVNVAEEDKLRVNGAMLIDKVVEGMKEHLSKYMLTSNHTIVKHGITVPCVRCKGSGQCDGAECWSDPVELITCPVCGGRGG